MDDDQIIVLVRDMIFVSRIRSAAEAVGSRIHLVRDPEQLAGQAGRKLIFDLNLPGAIEAAGDWRLQNAAEVVGFVAHVDTGTIQRARNAGIEHIMARSQFVRVLPDLLR